MDNEVQLASEKTIDSKGFEITLATLANGVIVILAAALLKYVVKCLIEKLEVTNFWKNFSFKKVYKKITDFLKWLWTFVLFCLFAMHSFCKPLLIVCKNLLLALLTIVLLGVLIHVFLYLMFTILISLFRIASGDTNFNFFSLLWTSLTFDFEVTPRDNPLGKQ